MALRLMIPTRHSRPRITASVVIASAVGCALWVACLDTIAIADTIDVQLTSAPNRLGTACFGMVRADLDADGVLELYEAGPALGNGYVSDSVISRLGPVVGGRLHRSSLVVPTREDGIAALVASPPPVARLFAFGSVIQLGIVETGVDVFSGLALSQEYSRAFPSFNGLGAATVADVSSSFAFSFAGGGSLWLGSYASSQSLPRWNTPRSAFAIAQAQLDGDAAPEWIVSGDGVLEIYDAESGAIEGSVPTVAYRTLVPVNLDVDPQLELVAAGDGVLATFELMPLALRWSRTSDFVRTAAVFDRNDDGAAEILAVTDDFLRWLDASAAPQEISPVDSRGVGRNVAVLDVTGDGVAEVVYTNGFSCDRGVTVRSLDLASVISYEAPELGPFDRLAVGNLDADEADEIVTLSAGLPSDPSTFGRTKVRVVDAASGIEQWQATVPGSTLSTIDDLRIVELAQGDDDERFEVFAYGSLAGGGGEGIVVFDGDGTLLRRESIPVGTDRRLLGARQGDANADGNADLVVVTGSATSTGVGLQIGLHDATTLDRLWNGPIFSEGLAIRFLDLMQLDSDPALEAVIGVDGSGVFAFDVGARQLQWSVAMAAPRSVALAPGVPAPWLAIAQRDQLTRVRAADGTEIDVNQVGFDLRGVAASPLDDSYLVLAADDRLRILDLPSASVTATTRDITRNLAARGTVIPRVVNGTVRWYVGNNAGVWSATVVREPAPLFSNGFEVMSP